MTTYLTRLSERLARGLARLGDDFRGRQLRYVLSTQNDDGGSSGRRGSSDVYYTTFALRAADMLNVSAPGFWKRSAAFVRKHSTAPADVTDCLSLLAARTILARRGQVLWCETCTDERVEAVRATLERHRSALGGFSKTPGGDVSLFHTFLAALCYDVLGEPVPEAEAAAALVASRQRSDGGFAELAATEASGTSPTAAAVGVLGLSGALGEISSRAAAEYLLAMQRPDGGFAAHAEAPLPDLLSTFTGLVTLLDLGAIRDVRLSAVGRYVKSLAAPSGGFLAAQPDNAADIEYTYYGLGTLALLAEQVPADPRNTLSTARRGPG